MEHIIIEGPTVVTAGYTKGLEWDGGVGGGSGSSTSLHAIGVYSKGHDYGYWLNGLSYSSLMSCSCDNCTLEAYHCEGSNLSFIGCGLESLTMATGSSGAWFLTNGYYQFQNCSAALITVTSTGNPSVIWCVGSNATFENCKFQDYSTPASAKNYQFQNSKIQITDSLFPTNGSGGTLPSNVTAQNDGEINYYNINTATLELVSKTSKEGIELYNATEPTTSVTDGIRLFSVDIASSAELRVRDEAGNTTTLSPHNFTLIPNGPSEDMAFSYYSERDGTKINVDMLKALRVLEQLSGEQLVYIEQE